MDDAIVADKIPIFITRHHTPLFFCSVIINVGKFAAIVKCRSIHPRYAAGYGNTCKVVATVKCKFTDISYAIGQSNARETGATLKRFITDSGYVA